MYKKLIVVSACIFIASCGGGGGGGGSDPSTPSPPSPPNINLSAFLFHVLVMVVQGLHQLLLRDIEILTG
jgi:hypothetical protein